MPTLGRMGDRDGYELHLRQCLDNGLSSPTAGIVTIGFDEVDDREVCVVSVTASCRPVFARPPGGTVAVEFWVRVGNATKHLHGEDMVAYQSEHWD